MKYIRLSEGLTSYKLIPETELWDNIKTNEKDYYSSIFSYNEDQFKAWKRTRTISGVDNVTTNRLVFDFDSAENIEYARKDAQILISRLLSYGVKQDQILTCFSGSKGFSVEVNTDKEYTPKEFKNIVFRLASDLNTFDKKVNDPSRVFRVPATKHPKSGLYKIPLTINQLSEFSTKDILQMAGNLDSVDLDILNQEAPCSLPPIIDSFKIDLIKKETVKVDIEDFDVTRKPKWLSSHKYALQEGFFREGNRSEAFMILASTYKNQGFAKEIVYRMLKGVAEKQAVRNSADRFPDKELWYNIVGQVFSPNWKGGSYSYDNTPLLQQIGEELNLKKDKSEDQILIPVDNVTSTFKKFALDIDKNTIKLGIPLIDDNVRITTSMSVGLLASASSGKTSVSLGILNANSKMGTHSLFFSLDMGAPLVYQRLIQRHLGYTSNQIFKIYQNNDVKKIDEIEKVIAEEYNNVRFCFRSGLTVEDIRESIIKYQEQAGVKVRLVVIDYLETIASQFSDTTASSGYVAQALKDIANDLELTILILLQPQKHAGDPSSELLSYRAAKGSSQIEQSLSVMLTLWRPGFSPITPEEDKYMSIAVVKNRMGNLAKFDFGWYGLKGELSELDDLQQHELNSLVARKKEEQAKKDLI